MHILLPELKRGDLQGFHGDLGDMIEKCGKVEVLAKKYGPNGIYRAIVKCGSATKDSTFFPHWSPQEFLTKLFEAVESIDFTKHKFEGVKKVKGVTKDGLEIEMAINFNKLKITTAYPYYKPWKSGDLCKKFYGKL